MIAIVNKETKNNKGETLYHLKINDVFMTSFWHRREAGLSECLLKASKACNKEKVEILVSYPMTDKKKRRADALKKIKVGCLNE